MASLMSGAHGAELVVRQALFSATSCEALPSRPLAGRRSPEVHLMNAGVLWSIRCATLLSSRGCRLNGGLLSNEHYIDEQQAVSLGAAILFHIMRWFIYVMVCGRLPSNGNARFLTSAVLFFF